METRDKSEVGIEEKRLGTTVLTELIHLILCKRVLTTVAHCVHTAQAYLIVMHIMPCFGLSVFKLCKCDRCWAVDGKQPVPK